MNGMKGRPRTAAEAAMGMAFAAMMFAIRWRSWLI